MWHADLYGYFRTPKMTMVSINAGQVLQIVAPNPDRVVLIITPFTAVDMIIQPAAVTGPNNGMRFSQAAGPIIFRQSEDGILAQCAWFSSSSMAGITVGVLEVILDRRPSEVNGYALKGKELRSPQRDGGSWSNSRPPSRQQPPSP